MTSTAIPVGKDERVGPHMIRLNAHALAVPASFIRGMDDAELFGLGLIKSGERCLAMSTAGTILSADAAPCAPLATHRYKSIPCDAAVVRDAGLGWRIGCRVEHDGRSSFVATRIDGTETKLIGSVSERVRFIEPFILHDRFILRTLGSDTGDRLLITEYYWGPRDSEGD
ncbi:hypothetical protein GCM10022281_14120 [Sphingomonas rosea]|uniref:Uncharacterized protein n=1 Tax=Sphingomonas rosea TaxID=335605 RepID=A0ABP7U2X5_9SPHN